MNIRNQVQLIGHVGNAPELIEVGTDKTLARFSIATNESYKNAQGEWVTNTEWHQVVAWNGTAKRVEKALQKGTELVLQGKLTTRSWEDAEVHNDSDHVRQKALQMGANILEYVFSN